MLTRQNYDDNALNIFQDSDDNVQDALQNKDDDAH